MFKPFQEKKHTLVMFIQSSICKLMNLAIKVAPKQKLVEKVRNFRLFYYPSYKPIPDIFFLLPIIVKNFSTRKKILHWIHMKSSARRHAITHI